MAFWGVVVTQDEPVEVTIPQGEGLMLSMAALCPLSLLEPEVSIPGA